MFEVRKPSRSGSKETGETDLGRVLPMNFPPSFPSVSVPELDSYCFFLEIIDSPAIMHCAHLGADFDENNFVYILSIVLPPAAITGRSKGEL